MPRPCGHKTHNPTCRICFWSSDCSDKGKAYRARWGEAEPDCSQPPALPSEGPSLFTKAINFGKAVVSHVSSGMPKASQEEKGGRLALCIICPHYNQKSDTCKLCGCNLSVKTGWKDQHCPIGKW